MTGESQKRKPQERPYYSPDYVRERLFIADMAMIKTKYGAAQGVRGASAELARYAAGLQKRGTVEFLLFSGGKRVFDPQTAIAIGGFQISQKNWPGLRKMFADAGNFLSPKREAELMRDVAIQEGVDPTKIIVEGDEGFEGPTSTNTAQNVERLLANEALLEDLKREGVVSVLAHAYHTRRTCGTWLAKMSPHRRDFNVVARSDYPFGFTPHNWNVPFIRDLVLKEAFETDLRQAGSLIRRNPEDVLYYDADRHLAKIETRTALEHIRGLDR